MLSAWDKQRFFEELEAFVGPCELPHQTVEPEQVIENDEISEKNVEMPAKRKTKETSSSASKTQKKNKIELKNQILENKKVVLVPIGADVSRKRLEIWQEIVEKHGGECMEVHMPKNQRRASTEKPFDWSLVDYVIASECLDLDKLCKYYKIHRFPSNVKGYTSEWLVHLSREKKLPSSDAYKLKNNALDKDVEEKKKHAEDTHDPDRDYWERDSEYEEDTEQSGGGSCHQLEIERAPRITVDTNKIELEEQEIEIKNRNEQLVKERIPIFYKNNPHFKGISSADQTTKLKNESFICQKTSMMQRNLNAHITDLLDELMEFLHVEKDIWREYSYKKVVSSLKAMTTRVSSVSDLKNLWWAKGRMREKVVEILETGKLGKLEAKKNNPRLQTLVKFSQIWGVGPVTAAKFYNMGYKSLEDLRTRGDEILSDQQKIGLKHYKDFLTKIPRNEVRRIEETVVNEVHRLLPRATALACGSYRRGKDKSGDCDILITDPEEEECGILPELLENLHKSGFLTDDLTHVYGHKMGRCDSYMGVCRLDKNLPYRRLDIKIYPRRFFGFALLYFTGSDHFNRSMRLFARKKGWSLSDRSLTRVIRHNGMKIEQGESVVCYSEVDVFIALGLEYKDPLERNCFDIRFLDEDEQNAKHGRKTEEMQ